MEITAMEVVWPAEDGSGWAEPMLVTGSYDATMIVWNFSDQEQVGPLEVLSGHSQGVISLSHSAGLLISCSWDNTARVWKGPNCVLTLKHEDRIPRDACVLPDGNTVAVGCAYKKQLGGENIAVSASVHLWDLPSGASRGVVETGFSDSINGCRVLGSSLVACSVSGEIQVRSGDTRRVMAQLDGHTDSVKKVVFHSSGMFISASSDRSIRVWGTGTDIATTVLPNQRKGGVVGANRQFKSSFRHSVHNL